MENLVILAVTAIGGGANDHDHQQTPRSWAVLRDGPTRFFLTYQRPRINSSSLRKRPMHELRDTTGEIS